MEQLPIDKEKVEKKRITFLNNRNEPVNIIHAQGKSFLKYKHYLDKIVEGITVLECPPDLTIISTWTDAGKCILKKELDKVGIPLINSYIPRDKEWTNPYKIIGINKALEKVTTKYVLILDGYDVLILNFDRIIEKFLDTGFELFYNATTSKFPKVDIDEVPNRDSLGDFKYFNAGCCIGLTSRAKEFYKQCEEIIDIENPYNSEQFILRHVFKNNIDKVFFDHERKIFQTLNFREIEELGDNKFLVK